MSAEERTVALSPDDVQALVDAFEASEWTEMTLTMDGTRVELSRTGEPPRAAPVAPAAPPPPVTPTHAPRPSAPELAPAAAAPVGASAPTAPAGAAPSGPLEHITAPTVGIFYRAADPESPPFVEIGRHVDPDDVVCIVEVMKLFHHVQAGVAGTIRAIEAENGAMVEHGQTLFLVEPDR